ncbi:MAG: hypothetical protein R3E13_06565 [Alphaproteobacteria bacterium]
MTKSSRPVSRNGEIPALLLNFNDPNLFALDQGAHNGSIRLPNPKTIDQAQRELDAVASTKKPPANTAACALLQPGPNPNPGGS